MLLDNLVTCIYSSDITNGSSSFIIPEQYRTYKLFLVSVYTGISGYFDGIVSHIIYNGNNNNSKYGSYYGGTDGNKYNYICIDSNFTIKKSASNDLMMKIVSIFAIR